METSRPETPAVRAVNGAGVESSAALAGRARQGERHALDCLVARYLPALRAWAGARLPPRLCPSEQIDALVRQAILDSVETMGHQPLPDDGEFLLRLREATRARVDELIGGGSGTEAPEAGVDRGPARLREAVGAEAYERYEQGLHALGGRERAAVVARIELGQEWDEVGHALAGESEEQARSRVSQAVLELAGATPGEAGPDTYLGALAVAVAEHAAVDWDEQLRRASGEHEREVVHQMQVIDEVARQPLRGRRPTEVVPSPLDHEAEAPGAPTLTDSEGAFAPGQVVGGRYRIRSFLGRGGMGEVWRGFDLKLRTDVALKTVREGRVSSERGLATLRQEVRTAHEVASPNVCRVFDLVELEGREVVSMEYVDGTTLAALLRERSPLELPEAQEIASQLLVGLAAIHDAGLVHRDLKPENVMLTRAGRVVVMDLGIARGAAEVRRGTISGTPAYMAPEQARGEGVDARADVFSVGVMLAEMVAPEGAADKNARRRVWEGVHRDPPRVADTPWAPVIRSAVAADREKRHPGAVALARALEQATLRAVGAEDARPYPGLAMFTEENAQYFFGREVEVEGMWRTLRRPHLLALIGPSGAGKSSFLRAGLIPARPEGWRIVVATPGGRPFMALAQALLPELKSDPRALEQLLRFEEPDVAVSLVSRWRLRHEQALIVIDQFEELFTLNPAEVQQRFCEMLSRLALDADARVLLSMRDDFLFQCAAHPALSPIFSELTPLRTPEASALRRALVQPALKCGYRFEDESLVEQMMEDVRGERGALPLLAFAMARLWEKRDRESGLLTRQAYEEIGGVSGALAQHAEATLERIGSQRVPMVREIFRNLVTAQGTRAARGRDELLSVFPAAERETVGTVLDALIDARLLVSYEAEAEPRAEAAG